MQRLSQRRGRLGLAGILERMADVVQLIGMVAVVVEHIGQQRQHLFVAHRLAAGVLMAVRVAVMCMIVIVFMFVHGKHSFLERGGKIMSEMIAAQYGLFKFYHIFLLKSTIFFAIVCCVGVVKRTQTC